MTTHIRIPDVSPVTQAVADGAKSVFSFPFPIFKAADLEVRANSTLVTTGYSVVGEGSSTGGAVIFTAAPTAGQRITLRRKQAYARIDDFLDERAPTPHELNDAVDQNVAALQELAEQVSRSVQRPLSADLSQSLDLSLPAPEAGKVLGWNPLANGLVNLNTEVDIPVGKVQVDVNDTPDYLSAKLVAGANIALTANAHSMTIAVPGLGSAATHAASDFASAAQGILADNALLKAQNLADLNNVATARNNLGMDVDGTLAADSDTKFPSQKAVKTYVDTATTALGGSALLKANHLSEFSAPADKTAARGNLGLGSAAVESIGTSGANVPLLSNANTYSAPQTPAAQVLTDADPVAIAITNQVWTLSTSAARTIGAPTGGVANTFYFLEIVTNGFTPSWDTAFDFGAAHAPANLSGTCGFDIFYDGSKYRISTRFTGGV